MSLGTRIIYLQAELVQCTWCLLFATLWGVSIPIALHLGQCSTASCKFAFNAILAISMQVWTFAYKFIYFNQAAITCNGRPCLQDMYPACVLCTAPASADTQFACTASLLLTSTIQPTAPLYNSLHATLALHNSITGSMVCGLTPDKQDYWPLLFCKVRA